MSVLGLNRRNALIARLNPRPAIALVRDKQRTKERLLAHGVPCPPTLLLLADRRQVLGADWGRLGPAWVVKPGRGSRGRGVLVTVDRAPGGWWRADGRLLRVDDVERHAAAIVDGEFSDGRADAALVEPLLRPHPALAPLAPVGLPDVRLLCHLGRPVLAMLRLPTRASGGRGNLHQGGIGAAVDLDTGRIERATHRGRPVAVHPDTGAPLVGVTVPHWPAVLAAASRCSAATGLGYLGADLVVDADLGVCVLEVNAHPGLEIQNVCQRGLAGLLGQQRR